MNMVLDATPVPFINPLTEKLDIIPLGMVQAYVPYAPHLPLEDAARKAAVLDFESAATLLRDLNGGIDPTISYPLVEEADYLTIQPPSLR